jgi:hypothetical protein
MTLTFIYKRLLALTDKRTPLYRGKVLHELNLPEKLPITPILPEMFSGRKVILSTSKALQMSFWVLLYLSTLLSFLLSRSHHSSPFHSDINAADVAKEEEAEAACFLLPPLFF